MCHLLLEHGSGKIGGFDVCVEMIAAQVGEPVDVFGTDHSFFRNDLVADLQFLKIFPERVFAGIFSGCVLLVNVGDRGNGGWRAL